MSREILEKWRSEATTEAERDIFCQIDQMIADGAAPEVLIVYGVNLAEARALAGKGWVGEAVVAHERDRRAKASGPGKGASYDQRKKWAERIDRERLKWDSAERIREIREGKKRRPFPMSKACEDIARYEKCCGKTILRHVKEYMWSRNVLKVAVTRRET